MLKLIFTHWRYCWKSWCVSCVQFVTAVAVNWKYSEVGQLQWNFAYLGNEVLGGLWGFFCT